MQWVRCALLTAITLMSCAELPTIEPAICGNAVVEPGEDCDTFAPYPGAVCRSKGSAGECHLDCNRHGTHQAKCPSSWGCGLDALCREPSGTYQLPVDYPAARAYTLLSGDLDGDGRDDVVGLEPLDFMGRTRLRIHYFNEQGQLSETRDFTKLVLTPSVADINRDGTHDLVISDSRVTYLPGRKDHALVPESYSSYRFAGTQLRMVPIYVAAIQGSISAAALLSQNGVTGYYYVDPSSGLLRLSGALPLTLDELVSDPVSGDIIEGALESPCQEVVVAARGKAEFQLADLCLGGTSSAAWRPAALQWSIALQPPAPIDAAPIIVDVNGDGHLDVLIGAGGVPYVSLGDGKTLSLAAPYTVTQATEDGGTTQANIGMPIAAGDISADGVVDFVFPDHLLVSTPTLDNVPKYSNAYSNLGARWTLARVMDVNANGHLDVIAASSQGPNIDLFNGNGTEFLTSSKISTSGPVQRLDIGDFDGDLIHDIAYTETDTADAKRDAVKIAFGTAYGLPEQPKQVARVNSDADIVATPDSAVDDLLVISNDLASVPPTGDLAILFGGDRVPAAPLQLTDYQASGSVNGSGACGFALGHFTNPAQMGLAALATPSFDPNLEDWKFWYVPTLDEPEVTAKRIGDPLDVRIVPSVHVGFTVHVRIAAAAGDVDGDGLDEALWALPADNDAHCAIVILGSIGSGIGVRNTLVVAEPCVRSQVVVVDADGDGLLDVAMLTGAADSLERQLVVYWNEGQGIFSDAHRTLVSDDDAPAQFTFLPPTVGRHAIFAYVTVSQLVTKTGVADPRNFARRQVVAELTQGSGVTSADVNGDGVADFVVAASGTLSVLKAELGAP